VPVPAARQADTVAGLMARFRNGDHEATGGLQANRRLLQVEQISHDCLLSEEVFQKVNRPIQIASLRASALRFADPQTQALWSALLLFQLLPNGFSNRNLRENLAPLLGQQPENLTQGG
jgi:hypothetical protein